MVNGTTFFSYARSDSDFALKLAKDLRDAGAELWLDQLDIEYGSRWDDSIEKALAASSGIIVIISPESVASDHVKDEFSAAMDNGKKIIPVLLADCITPLRLRRFQHIDFRGDYQTGFNHLLRTLNHSISDNKKSKVIESEPLILQNPEPDIPGIDLAQKEKELETLFWEKAKAENTINSYNHYLQEYPRGENAEDALNAIARIEKAEKQKQETLLEERVILAEQETKLWEEACRLNTIPYYKKYLNETKSAEHKEKAKQLIEQLDLAQKEKELETRSWEKAKAENTISSYNYYLQEYPQGIHRTEALTLIEEIEKNDNKQKAIRFKNEILIDEPLRQKSRKNYYLIAGGAFFLGIIIIWGVRSANSNNKEREALVAMADSIEIASLNSNNGSVTTEEPDSLKTNQERNQKEDSTMYVTPKHTETSSSKEETVFNYVEQMPEFPNGATGLRTYLSQNIIYPKLAIASGIEGKVIVRFIVRKDGIVSDPRIINGIGFGCDEEALRVVLSMPYWKPGKQNGKDVSVYYQLPIKFKLQ